MVGDPLQIVINARPEHRMQTLQRKTRAVAAFDLERKIDQALGDGGHVHHVEGIVREYGASGVRPGLIACECHVVMMPCIRYGQRACLTRARAVAVCVLLASLLSGCDTAPQRPWAGTPDLAQCQQMFAANDAELHAAGIADAQANRVAGYPFLRVDRVLASFAVQTMDHAQRAAWLTRAAAHDAEGRELEIARLLPAPDGALRAQLSNCRVVLSNALGDDDEAWRTMLAGAEVADDYHTLRRVLGLYALSARVVLAGVRRLQAREMPRLIDARADDAVGGESYGLLSALGDAAGSVMPQPWRRDALGFPLFSAEELDNLLRRHAPQLSIDTRSDDDRPGRITRNTPPFVSQAEPVLYSHLAYTRFGDQVLPQLVYTWWFTARSARGRFDPLAGPLDGMSWRVTLDVDGQPLAYDVVHNCGCYHMFFPSARLRVRSPTKTLEEPPWVPFTIPTPWQGRLRLVVASGSHYLRALAAASNAAPAHGYALRPYVELRALAAGAQRSSLFDGRGLVAASTRGERWFLWPMGIIAPGSMRQWGRQATAFVGRRHFDEARLLERYFERAAGAALD